jgi:glycosyltransferase involved in cell wall biosynthesis
MRKLQILLLNFEYPPLGGGASPVSKEIASSLVKNGHDISVVTMGFGSLPKYQKDEKIQIYRLDSGRKKSNISQPFEQVQFLWHAKRFLESHLKDHNYDVIHCHFILSTGILARWVKRKFGIPYIITAHGSDLPGYNPDRFKLIHWFTPYLIRKILKDCAYIVSPSHYLAGLIQPFLKKDINKLLIIPNGIKVDSYYKSPKQKIILSTGRLLKRKGFHTLIAAVKDIKSEFVVHICGDGPMRGELEKMAVNSQTKIVFHGWIENTSKKYLDLLSSATIYCLVSSFENASISLLEAMANGCAVITSNVTGCPETVGDSGICIDPDNPQSLSKEIERLISKPNLITELGERAVHRVKDKFLWDKIAKAYENILIEVTDSQN